MGRLDALVICRQCTQVTLFLALVTLQLLNWLQAKRIPTPLAVLTTVVVALLVLGVLVWSAAHLLPCSAPGLRSRLVARLGEGPYKGLFALTIVLSIVLMVLGWRSAQPGLIYAAPISNFLWTNLLMVVALLPGAQFIAVGVDGAAFVMPVAVDREPFMLLPAPHRAHAAVEIVGNRLP